METCRVICFKIGAKVESIGFIIKKSEKSLLTYPKMNPLQIIVDIFLLAVRETNEKCSKAQTHKKTTSCKIFKTCAIRIFLCMYKIYGYFSRCILKFRKQRIKIVPEPNSLLLPGQ
jgi:hypothetical protein